MKFIVDFIKYMAPIVILLAIVIFFSAIFSDDTPGDYWDGYDAGYEAGIQAVLDDPGSYFG